MRPVNFQQVRNLVGMHTVLRLIGWQAASIERNRRRGPCPVHRDPDHAAKSFVVQGDKWYCFQCRRGGNHLDLYATVRELPLLDAAVKLCEAAGVEVPYLPRRERQPRPPRAGGRPCDP